MCVDMTYYIGFVTKVANVILYRKAELAGCNGPLGPLGTKPEDAEMLIPNDNPGMSTKIV